MAEDDATGLMTDEGVVGLTAEDEVAGLMTEEGVVDLTAGDEVVGLTAETATDEVTGAAEDVFGFAVETALVELTGAFDDAAEEVGWPEALEVAAPAAEQPTLVAAIATSSYQNVSVLPAYDSQPKYTPVMSGL